MTLADKPRSGDLIEQARASDAHIACSSDERIWVLANNALDLTFSPRSGSFIVRHLGSPQPMTLPFLPFVVAIDGGEVGRDNWTTAAVRVSPGDANGVALQVTMDNTPRGLRLHLTMQLHAEGGPLRWQASSGIEGRSSAENVPWFALEAADGSGFYAGLEWSAPWLADLRDHGPASELTADMAVVRRALAAGESLDATWIFLGAYQGGLDDAANRLHRWLQRSICPPTPPDFPWTQYNSWYAYQADFDEALLRRDAEQAAALGLEVFVVDDGWFRGRKRRERSAGWGDWTGDPDRFPGGLEQFSRHVHDLGMRFGLWVEPEQIDRRGALATAHPDWFLTIDGREVQAHSGEQTSAHLCLGHPDVVAWLQQDLSRMVRQYEVDWIKWDYNIGYGPGCDSLRHGHQAGDGSYAYVHGLWAVLGHLNRAFPKLMLEGCASGGRRIDFGLLSFIHTEWLSDVSQGAASVRSHVTGASRALPTRYLNTFVVNERPFGALGRAPAAPPTPPSRLTDTDFRSRMAGAFGISARISEWDADTLAMAKDRVAEYKTLRPLLQGRRYLLLPRPLDLQSWDAWQLIDEESGSAAILAFNNQSPDRECLLHPRGLRADTSYKVSGSGVSASTSTGRDLGETGVRCRLVGAGGSSLIWLRAQAAIIL